MTGHQAAQIIDAILNLTLDLRFQFHNRFPLRFMNGCLGLTFAITNLCVSRSHPKDLDTLYYEG
ncbi:hypothetical protein J2T17_001556 [Paenibacillus mucilaginosus]